MILIVTASADTYITNKFVDNIPAVSSSTGRAGTIDLFKLYNHPSAPPNTIELSRALLKFDYDQIKELVDIERLDVDSMKAYVRLKNVSAGQSVPQNFTLNLFPLAKEFNEGIGRDVISFADLDTANFIRASKNQAWEIPGASQSGSQINPQADYYDVADLFDGFGLVPVSGSQEFKLGTEDLKIDVTKFVRATILGALDNNGFRLSYSEVEEQDTNNYFVKRFASRHVSDVYSRPRLEVIFDDSQVDDRSRAIFNVSGTLYITNNVNGVRELLVSGSDLSPISGSNSLILQLSTGSYSKQFMASQDTFRPGTYKSPFIITEFDTGIVSGSVTLAEHIAVSGSVTFDEKWLSLDQTVTFLQSQITFRKNVPVQTIFEQDELSVRTSGPGSSPPGQLLLIRPRFYDLSLDEKSSKFPFIRKPIHVKGQYRIVDAATSRVYIDFDSIGTNLSFDDNGNFFEIFSSALPLGRPVRFEYKVTYRGSTRIIKDAGYTFKLVPR